HDPGKWKSVLPRRPPVPAGSTRNRRAGLVLQPCRHPAPWNRAVADARDAEFGKPLSWRDSGKRDDVDRKRDGLDQPVDQAFVGETGREEPVCPRLFIGPGALDRLIHETIVVLIGLGL